MLAMRRHRPTRTGGTAARLGIPRGVFGGLFAAVLSAIACDQARIDWGEPTVATGSASGRVMIDSAGHIAFAPLPIRPANLPMRSGMCDASMQVVRDSTRTFAVWWNVRPDSSADLLFSASDDGGASWSLPIPVDTLDHGGTACTRPPPALAVSGAWVYVAYSMAAREGTGVFLTHSMDRGTMFHSTVPVLYGDRLVHVSVAADSAFVVVAYEDPNSAAPTIFVAISRTQGHFIEDHVLASNGAAVASAPDVSLAGREVAVSYDVSRDSLAARAVRVGRIR
jgi:hypothetical protein